MIIGIDIRCFANRHRTGVGEYTYELLTALFTQHPEHQYVLFLNSFRTIEDFPDWGFPHVHIVWTRWPNKLFHLCQFFRFFSIDQFVWRQVASLFPDATGFDWWYAPNMHVMHVSSDVKFALTIHDLSFEIYRDCFYWRQRLKHWIVSPKKLCERADVIVVPSESTQQDVRVLYAIDEHRVRVVYPGIAALFQKDVSEQKKRDSVLFLGTLEPRKNVEAVVRAHQLLPEAMRTQYPLILAGSSGWKSRALRRVIAQDAHITYLGYVSAEKKRALYLQARVFVFPSLYEGFGFPVLEAMASGAAVITSQVSSLPEVGDDAVYFVDPLDQAQISTVLRQLLEDDMLCDSLAAKGEKRAMAFSWAHAAQEFICLLDN